ncbi:Raf kinase inhibitor-like YbhB/YbcL family protein [Lysobacter enzymogenes]|uniref:YbhB/YbcL family Raf kinase inhibitor-like protein n=1 Tax=Lysobacter enzymogenes TaxID=69 RepID=UPI003399D18E
MKASASGIALSLLAFSAGAQQGDGTQVAIQAEVFKPAKVEATAERLSTLRVPVGFTIRPFASGLKNPRIIVVAPDGTIYVSRREQGDVIMLRDADGDGRADGDPVVVARRAGAHGLAIKGRELYLATVKELFRAPIQADGTLGPLEMLAGDLPDGGQHPNRTMAFGPDGMLYLSVGSSCNACNETNPEHATMLRVAPDGKSRTIFATGLRNTIGFDWEPSTGELWGMDHGIDFLGNDVQPEELNRIRKGRQYGWPHIYGDGGINPQSTPPGEITKAQWRAMSEPMALGYTAHAAPMQMLFYRGGMLPDDYRGDAFVTMRGSWNRRPASGYEIVRVKFDKGRAMAFEPFVSGFLTDGGQTHIARPVGLAQARDGALLLGDDANGVIYRIAYERKGGAAEVAVKPAPARSMQEQNGKGVGVPLALARGETKTDGRLEVASPAISADGALDRRYSEYADGVSVPLRWSSVPGARSYLVIAEDPDAKPITPFVHWVAWNIPAQATELAEGLPEQMRLTEPEGVLQGATSRGSVGYYGPRPPVGDPPRHYHFQVFALDTVLSVAPGSDRDQVLSAAKGHIIAKGSMVATYRQIAAPLK